MHHANHFYGHAEVLARQGAMVAYQGQMDFSYQGSGGGMKLLKKMATGEGANMMRASGHGEVLWQHERRRG